MKYTRGLEDIQRVQEEHKKLERGKAMDKERKGPDSTEDEDLREDEADAG